MRRGAGAPGEAERPVRLVRWIVRFPRALLGAFLSLPLALSAVGMLFFELEDLQGWDVRNSESSINFDSFVVAVETVGEINSGPAVTAERTAASSKFLDLFVVSRRPNQNLLAAPDDLFYLADLEQQILATEDMQGICLLNATGGCEPPISVTRFLMTSQAQFNATTFALALQANPDQTRFSLSRDFDFEATDPTTLRLPMVRSRFQLGLPLPGFASSKVRVGQQEDLLMEVVQALAVDVIQDLQDSNPNLTVYFDFEDLVEFFAFQTLERDAVFAGAAIAIVCVMLSVHTGSIFLGLMGALQIILSFPTCFFVYRIVLGITHFGTLQVLAIFVVLGIGADDQFVLHDAWLQSKTILRPHSGENADAYMERRLSWAFRKAAAAMFVTSLTTFVAFLVNALSPIINIRVFGIFASFLIVVNYLMVITIFPCLIVVNERHVAPFRTCLCCCGIRNPKNKAAAAAAGGQIVPQSKADEDSVSFGRVERFFRDVLAPALGKYRLAILVGMLALVAVFIFLASRFEPSSKRIDDIFAEDHPVSVVNRLKFNEFVFVDNAFFSARIVVGLHPINRDGVALFDPTERGTLSFDQDFDLLDPAAQQGLFDLCTAMRDGDDSFLRVSEDNPAEKAVSCWILPFQVWLEAQPGGFTFPLDSLATRTQLETWLTTDPEAQRFGDVIYGVGGSGAVPNDIRFAAFDVVLNAGRFDPLTRKLATYEDLQSFLDAQFQTMPASLGDPIVVSDDFVWLNMQEVLVRQALIGLGSGIAFGSAVLLVLSRSPRVTAAASLTILAITAIVLGLMNSVGWQIGFMEAISITVLVGLALDYTLHIVIAYVEFTPDQAASIAQVTELDHHPRDFVIINGVMIASRSLRMRCAMTRIGVSVLFGAITTTAAAIALMLCEIQYLGQFGAFLVMVIVTSLFCSNILLPALLATIGPQQPFPGVTSAVAKPAAESLMNK